VTGSGKFFTVNSNNLSNSIIKLRKIQTNFFDYGNQPEFKSVNKVSIRGIEIYKDLMYVSYIKSNNNCYNLSVLEGVITDNKVVFKPFFSPEECIEILDPNSSQLHSSGGAMLRDENNLYVAIGDFLESTNSQVMDNYYGKILKFGINEEEIEILSSGHRNIQGMTFYNGSILAVEHGPKGGDELNIVDVESRILQNFGWPISSYGEHYDGKFDKDKPLHKSHSKYGFIEPVLYFTPSIGISDIKVFSDKYMISSMKSGRLYTLSEDSENNVYNQNYLSIDRRIREIFILDEKLLLFLEDKLGLAVLDINK
jgi:glucose/arabinose dehydrogenase